METDSFFARNCQYLHKKQSVSSQDTVRYLAVSNRVRKRMFLFIVVFCLFVSLYAADAAEGVECAGITDKGEVAGNDGNEHVFIVAYVVVAGNMAFQLRLTSALGGKETEGNQFTHPEVEARTRVVVAEAVVGQPFVDMAAILWA